MMENDNSLKSQWKCFGKNIPKAEIIFFSQVMMIYIIILSCIFNLTYKSSYTELWVSLLSYCLGCLLPTPYITKNGYMAKISKKHILQSLSSS